jgi:hypothetical protein
MNINTFQAGETVGIWAMVKNWEGDYVDPDNGVKLVSLINPAGVTILSNKTMAHNAVDPETGKFVYYYNSQTDDVKGWWHYSCKSQDGTGDDAKYVIVEGSFELK